MDKNAISTSELKAHCSNIVKNVAQNRVAVVITKHGRPMAKLVPIEKKEPSSLFGFARGGIIIHGDIVEPLEVEWEANT
jgi:prevent-host-death family protein